MTQTDKLTARIAVLEKQFAKQKSVTETGEHNRTYYSLKGMIGKLKKELAISKSNDWLAK